MTTLADGLVAVALGALGYHLALRIGGVPAAEIFTVLAAIASVVVTRLEVRWAAQDRQQREEE